MFHRQNRKIALGNFKGNFTLTIRLVSTVNEVNLLSKKIEKKSSGM